MFKGSNVSTIAELEKQVANLTEQLAVQIAIAEHWQKEAGEAQNELASWRAFSAEMEKFFSLEQVEAYWRIKNGLIRPKKRRRKARLTDERIDETADWS